MKHPALPHLVLLGALLICSAPLAAQQTISFTAEQAENGRNAYRDTCQICHGSSLANGQFGTPLKGTFFRDKWKGKSLGDLLQFMVEKMPPDKVMSLTPDQSAELLAFIFSRNDMMPGDTPLPGDYKNLMGVMLPW